MKGSLLARINWWKNKKQLEHYRIPEDFQYEGVPGLSHEVAQKLEEIRPVTLGQAARISGITPSAVSLIMLLLEKSRVSS